MDIGAIGKPLGQGVGPVPVTGAAAVPAKGSPGSAPVSDVEDVASPLERVADVGQTAGREEVEDAVASIQEFVQSVRRSINFSVEDGSGRVVVKVTDAESGNVIRQIPSEEALKLAENLSEVRSLLFKAEA